tara:strand:- start:56 stop:310 length:255 start_codon:yes stop_codon:yes gene_type:complete
MSLKKLIKYLKNIPISSEANKIFINLFMKTKLKLKKFFIFRKINNKMALNQDDIVVAIGIIMNPTSLKNIILINIFNKTDAREI